MRTTQVSRSLGLALALAAGLAIALPAAAAVLTPQSVQLDGQALFQLAPAAGRSAEERAATVNRRLAQWVELPGAGEVLRIAHLRRGPALMLGDEPLLVITAEDAQLEGKTQDELANSWKEQISRAAEAPPAGAGSQGGTPWAWLQNVLSLLGILGGGAVAAWLVRWTAARMATEPARYGLRLEGRWVGIAGAITGFLVAAGAIGATLVYLPAQSMPIAATVVVVGAALLVLGAELLGSLAGGIVIRLQELYVVGDHIRLGSFPGQVVKAGWIFTRLRTVRHGTRLVPNSMVLRRGCALLDRPEIAALVLPVRLAYTVPRELAEALIVEAACRTAGLADDPLPTCLISGLEDEHICYQLHAQLADGEAPELAISRFQINLLEVLSENELAPGGIPAAPRLRIGLTTMTEGPL